jgi:hypothetical protein
MQELSIQKHCFSSALGQPQEIAPTSILILCSSASLLLSFSAFLSLAPSPYSLNYALLEGIIFSSANLKNNLFEFG